MKRLNLFIQITRLNRPIGYLLLFWPCLWGLTLAYDSSISINIYIFYVILFFLGSLFMRSAGCIVNDISDKNFDKKVERTKNRPIASGEMSIKIAFFYVIVLCGLALMVLINFNNIDKAGDFDEIEETSPEIYKQLSKNAFTEANCCGFGTDKYSTLDEAIVNMGEEYKNIQSYIEVVPYSPKFTKSTL